MPRRKKRKLVVVHSSDKATVLLIWVDPAGEVQRKTSDWHRPTTSEAIEEWMSDYIDRIADGYRPAAYDYVPMPHCARVMVCGLCRAEWQRSLTIDEIVRIDSRRAS